MIVQEPRSNTHTPRHCYSAGFDAMWCGPGKGRAGGPHQSSELLLKRPIVETVISEKETIAASLANGIVDAGWCRQKSIKLFLIYSPGMRI